MGLSGLSQDCLRISHAAFSLLLGSVVNHCHSSGFLLLLDECGFEFLVNIVISCVVMRVFFHQNFGQNNVARVW